MFCHPKNISSHKDHMTFLDVCVCFVYVNACMCISVHACVCVRFFSSARKLLWLYQFSGETVSPSGLEENSSVNIIGKRCPIEI